MSGNGFSAKKKVLGIGDEPAIRACLSALLEDHGCQTRQAATAILGVEAAGSEAPDLTGVDILMRHEKVLEPRAFVEKPIDVSTFLETVRWIIGAANGAPKPGKGNGP